MLEGLVTLPISFRAANTNPTTTQTNAYTPTNAGNIDQHLVGSWTKQTNINSGSGSGFASFSTETLFVLRADGTFEYGASRSMGGGSSWSYDGSNWSNPELTGTWMSQNGSLFITTANGQTVPKDQQRTGSYYIEGNSLLITDNNGNKELWQR